MSALSFDSFDELCCQKKSYRGQGSMSSLLFDSFHELCPKMRLFAIFCLSIILFMEAKLREFCDMFVVICCEEENNHYQMNIFPC